MAQRWHVNGKGDTMPCSVPEERCKFGGKHFDTEAEAAAYVEGRMDAQTQAPVTKKASAREKPTVEVYRHPQGKVATITNGVLEVTKGGKIVKSSATVDNLRGGHGRWVKDNEASHGGSNLRSIPERNEQVECPRCGTTFDHDTNYEDAYCPKCGEMIDISDVNMEIGAKSQDRTSANITAGYPGSSPYDAQKASEISEREPHKSGYGSPASILPLNARGNPHNLREMPVGEKLRFWNSKNSDGSERCDSTFEVWSDGNGKYKAVVTASDWVAGRGSEQHFIGDQTGKRMGDKWRMVGAFRPIEDGAIVGEVPNRSMPIYTYK